MLYVVDVNKPQGAVDASPPPPPFPDYPSPPPNAINLEIASQTSVHYNQTVVLQCLTSGVVSPILIIRRVDHATIAVGGGKADAVKSSNAYCVNGEVCGDAVSQLHKIGFEVYDPKMQTPAAEDTGSSGVFLSCMGEKVNTFVPLEGRMWNPVSLPRKARSASPPASPSLLSGGSRQGVVSRSASPPAEQSFSSGGRVTKTRRAAASASVNAGPAVNRGRRRAGSAGTAAPVANDVATLAGATWQVDIGETSVWTIVGTGAFFLVSPEFLSAKAEACYRSSSVQLLRSTCVVQQPAPRQSWLVPCSNFSHYSLPSRLQIPSCRHCRRNYSAQHYICAIGCHEQQDGFSRLKADHHLRRQL